MLLDISQGDAFWTRDLQDTSDVVSTTWWRFVPAATGSSDVLHNQVGFMRLDLEQPEGQPRAEAGLVPLQGQPSWLRFVFGYAMVLGTAVEQDSGTSGVSEDL